MAGMTMVTMVTMTPELLLDNLLAHWLQAGALAVVALVGVTAVRLRNAGVQLLGWQALLLLLVLLPWIQPWQPVAPPAVEADHRPAVRESVSVPGGFGVVTLAGRPAERPGADPWHWIVMLLGAGVVARVGWLATGMVRLRRVAGRSGGTDAPEAAAELQRRIGVSVRFVRAPETRTPYSFGVLRPTIVLPVAFDDMERSCQRAMLCHELVHIRRRDFVCALLEEAVVACLWFHPWVWVVRRRLRLAREQVVDAAVVRLTGDRPAYVRCLVALAGGRRAPSLAASMSRPGEVRARTDALFQEVGMSKRRLTVGGIALCLVLGATAWLSIITVPLRAISPVQGGTQSSQRTLVWVDREGREEPLATQTQQPADDQRRAVVLDFTLPSGYRTQTRGWEGQQMRIWLRDAGKLGFVPTFPDDSNQRVIVTVHDLDGAPAGPLGQIEVEVGGAPVTFRAAAPFEIAIPRILGPDFFEAIREEQRRYDAERAAQFELIASEMRDVFYIAAAGLDADRVRGGLARGNPVWSPDGLWLAFPDGTSRASSLRVFVEAAPPGSLGEAHPEAVRVGGDIEPPQKTRTVDPRYPPEARAAGVAGVVILEVLVDREGRVTDSEVLRSIPLLDAAALEAVRQWEYTPIVINGVAVPAIMTVTIQFHLR